MTRTVMTVTGPIDVDELGFTLMHEHIFLDLMRDAWVFANVLNDLELADVELQRLVSAGGATIVDLTSGGLREHDKHLLYDEELNHITHAIAVRRASEKSGIKVILGAGWYHENYYEPRLWEMATDALADEIVREIDVGIDGTDVRAGHIGEIGAHYNWLSAIEERVLRAAARAQIRTGLGLTTHSVLGIGGIEQLDVLEQEGVDLRRVVAGHSGWYPRAAYHDAIARRGAAVSFDRMGSLPNLSDFHRDRVLRLIKELIDNGHIEQIVLAHDVCYATDLATNNGCGYAWLSTNGEELLAAEIGLTSEQWEIIMVENPKRILAG